jgi:hypothetical protein
LLPTVAIGTVISVLVIEPVTMRAAFSDRLKA